MTLLPCPQFLATGLSGLYSGLPSTRDLVVDEWQSPLPVIKKAVPELRTFIQALDFCNSVLQVSSIRDMLRASHFVLCREVVLGGKKCTSHLFFGTLKSDLCRERLPLRGSFIGGSTMHMQMSITTRWQKFPLRYLVPPPPPPPPFQVAPKEVCSIMLTLVREGFLQQVMGPALLQVSWAAVVIQSFPPSSPKTEL